MIGANEGFDPPFGGAGYGEVSPCPSASRRSRRSRSRSAASLAEAARGRRRRWISTRSEAGQAGEQLPRGIDALKLKEAEPYDPPAPDPKI